MAWGTYSIMRPQSPSPSNRLSQRCNSEYHHPVVSIPAEEHLSDAYQHTGAEEDDAEQRGGFAGYVAVLLGF